MMVLQGYSEVVRLRLEGQMGVSQLNSMLLLFPFLCFLLEIVLLLLSRELLSVLSLAEGTLRFYFLLLRVEVSFRDSRSSISLGRALPCVSSITYKCLVFSRGSNFAKDVINLLMFNGLIEASIAKTFLILEVSLFSFDLSYL